MPHSICKRLQVGELKPTTISIQLKDYSVKYPMEAQEDVPLQVEKFFIPCSFVVMELEEDTQTPIILGCPFLVMIVAMIDVKNGKLSLQVGKEKLEFNLPQAIASPYLEDVCYRVDLLKKVVLEDMGTPSPPTDPLEACLIGICGNGVYPYSDEEIEIYAKVFNLAQPYLLRHQPREVLNVEIQSCNEDSKGAPS